MSIKLNTLLDNLIFTARPGQGHFLMDKKNRCSHLVFTVVVFGHW